MQQDTKIKKFIYKGQYLDVELNETNDLYEVYNNKFKKDFSVELAYLRKRNAKLEESMNKEQNEKKDDDAPQEEQDKEDIDESKDETKDEANDEENDEENDEFQKQEQVPINKERKFTKILYRKITIKTHPDKTRDTDLHEIFKLADVAYKECNLLDLLIIAIQLRIKIPKCEFEITYKLENDIKNKEIKIEDLKSTVAWNWGSKCDDPDERNRLKKYLYGMWGLPDDFLETANNQP